MEADNVEYLYGEILKVDEDQHIVEGYISSDQVDIGGHIIDQDWLKKTIPAWVADWGNVREMHSVNRAVGTVKEADVTTAPGPYVKAKIVDDSAWEKVKAGVYKGFSVGVKNPVIIKDAAAPKGRVVGGDFLELSIVDRPANSLARFTMYKSASAGGIVDVQHGIVLEPDTPTASPEVAKADLSAAGRRAAAASGAAESDGSFPIDTVEDLKKAVKDWGRAGAKPSDKAHIVSRARALKATSELPKDWLEKTVESEATGHVAPDLAKAAASAKPAHVHPFKGTHNHEHDDMRGGTHTHAHTHDEDDMHDHPHLGGKDARLLTPEQRTEAKSMQRDSYNFTVEADLTKGDPAPDVVGENAAPRVVSPVSKLDQLETQMREIRAQIEALANETDQDRDGDVDFPARDPRDDSAKPSAGFRAATAPTPTVVTPERLPLSLSATPDLGAVVPDLVKNISDIIDRRLEERMDVLRAELNSKTEVTDIAGTTADVAKFASGIARGLADLAVSSEAIAKRVADSQAEARKLSDELERVKRIAQPTRGQTAQAIEKTIGADVYPEGSTDLAKSASAGMTFDDLVDKARNMKDESTRKLLAEEVYKIVSVAQRRQ